MVKRLVAPGTFLSFKAPEVPAWVAGGSAVHAKIEVETAEKPR
jgi:hypothetical protein